MNAHAQARQASQHGVRHVVFSHQGGLMVMTPAQAHAFQRLVTIDATYFRGFKVSA